MLDEVYEYLSKFGFNDEQLNKIEDENEMIFFANLNDVKNNIEFLESKNLTKEEIIDLINKNNFMITCSNKRKNAFEKIYVDELHLSNEEIKKMLLINPDIYIVSPIEIEQIIRYLLTKYSIEQIKELVLSNPMIINKKLDDIKSNL